MKTFIFAHYVENCTPKIKRFRTKKAFDRWHTRFTKEKRGNPDNDFDYAISGYIVEMSDYYSQYVK
jgi:hypothetical protein